LRLAVDFVKEGRIYPGDALQRLTGLDVQALVEKRLVVTEKPVAYGTGASSGVAVGRAAFDPQSAARLAASGEPVILIRQDVATADVSSFAIAAGIITAVGGRTAHAALVARQMGKPCIVGCTTLSIEAADHFAKFGGVEVKTADWLSIDGTAGAIYLGRADVVTERPEAELAEIERWRALAAA
jgi:pyruvate,orthophosphate dikinase